MSAGSGSDEQNLPRIAPRTARIERRTGETEVLVDLALDGSGQASSDTGVPFFDHMVNQLGKHAGFDLTVRAMQGPRIQTLLVHPHHA